MDQLIAYFSHIPSSHRSAILIGGIAFFLVTRNGCSSRWHAVL